MIVSFSLSTPNYIHVCTITFCYFWSLMTVSFIFLWRRCPCWGQWLHLHSYCSGRQCNGAAKRTCNWRIYVLCSQTGGKAAVSNLRAGFLRSTSQNVFKNLSYFWFCVFNALEKSLSSCPASHVVLRLLLFWIPCFMSKLLLPIRNRNY